jgi:hypothetical protein
MTWAEVLMFGAAISAMFAARRNATATALVLAFFTIQVWWFAGGEVLDDPGTMFMIDFAVVVWIFVKAVMRCRDESALQCVAKLTLWDRLILALFLFGTWPTYVANVSDYHRWYALWGIAMAQFLLADIEAFLDWRRAKASSEPGIHPPGVLRAAWAGAGDSG